MRRFSYLFEQLIEWENLLSAYRKAYRGSGKSKEAARFTFFLERELIQLREELQNGTYHPQNYRTFRLYDPKERTISVASFKDRVAHHALVNILEPIYEPRFIFDSYATRKGKGTWAAIQRAQSFIKKHPFYLRLDVRKFFDSVNHDILLGLLRRYIKDSKFLFIAESIIYSIPNGHGLPIGNMTSQFLANVYLDPLDHYIKEFLRVKYYIRYMDDMLIFEPNTKCLTQIQLSIEKFLWNKLRLSLKLSAVSINHRQNGASFLGARIFPSHIRILPESLHRSLKRLKRTSSDFEIAKISESKMADSHKSIIGHLAQFDSYQLRCSLGQRGIWR